jgi:transcription elongation GreA/GreB family factor
MEPDKERVLAALRDASARELAAAARMTEAAREEATGSESRAENQYDTRATEASYLAAGQGRRWADLRAFADWLEQVDPRAAAPRVGLGALVGVWRAGATEWVLVAPEGGRSVVVDGVEVRLVSARSPAGEVLEGLEEGETTEVDTPRGPVEIRVARVR